MLSNWSTFECRVVPDYGRINMYVPMSPKSEFSFEAGDHLKNLTSLLGDTSIFVGLRIVTYDKASLPIPKQEAPSAPTLPFTDDHVSLVFPGCRKREWS